MHFKECVRFQPTQKGSSTILLYANASLPIAFVIFYPPPITRIHINREYIIFYVKMQYVSRKKKKQLIIFSYKH